MGCCEHCNGNGASTVLVIYLMDVKGVCSLPRYDSALCSQLKN